MLEQRTEVVQRQCAWCLSVMDQSGVYSVRAARKLRAATHGICPGCKAMMRAEIDSQPAPLLLAA